MGGYLLGLPPFKGTMSEPSERWYVGMRNVGYPKVTPSDMPAP
jgi:hypothetical protein